MRCIGIGIEFGADIEEWVGLCLSLVLRVVLLAGDRACSGPEKVGSGIGSILSGATKDRHASGSNARQPRLGWEGLIGERKESGKRMTKG